MLPSISRIFTLAVFALTLAVVPVVQADTTKETDPVFAEVAKHFQAGVDELEKLADSGNVKAQRYLGIMKSQGILIPIDHDDANKHLKAASDAGDATAHHFLAVQYLNGSGVGKDKAKAKEHFQKAADMGHSDAKKALNTM